MGTYRSFGGQEGFTIIELIVSFTVLSIVVLSIFGLLASLEQTSVLAKNMAIANTLATNQIEYLKGLPYDSLAVAGGSIYATNPLPAVKTVTENGITYTVTTSINYVDDAYDGCAKYPTLAEEELLCRNYPPPSGAPAVDTNPEDYKIIHVSVTDKGGAVLAGLDTEISGSVAETSNTTGALLVTVIDSSGNPISGATVNVNNSAISPILNLSETTDNAGIAIFYGMPPDNNADYIVSASDSGYSSLSTIATSGSLIPTYPNQTMIAQQPSSVTLTLNQMTSPSLLVQAVDTSGNPISGLSVYLKGGYKKYTATTDSSYYYDNYSPDTRPQTDSSGLVAFNNLAPGPYFLCGDSGSSDCTVGSTTYYLVAAMPYGGSNSFNPVTVPIYNPSSPPTVTYSYNSSNYIQKAMLVFSTSSSFPRISTIDPSTFSISSTNLSSFSFTLTGANLPCSSTASSCLTTVNLIEGTSTYATSCTGTSGTDLICTADLGGVTQGFLQIQVKANGFNYTTPISPPLGGISVTP